MIKPYSSKLHAFMELLSQIDVTLLLFFVVYLHFHGNSISERSLMNVGYGMLAVILPAVLFGLIVNLVKVLIAFVLFFKRICRRNKKRGATHVEL